VTTLIRNELLKLRTIRSPWLLVAVTQVIIVIGVSGLFIGGADVEAAATPVGAVGHAGLLSLCTLILGITAIAGEYRHKSITDSYLATPSRGRFLAAKLVAYTGFGVGFGIINAITALAASAVWLAAKGGTFDLGDPAIWRTVLGGIGWNAAFTAIGVGVGALVRNLTTAIAGALAWLALVEGLVGQLMGDQARWLPFNSGLSLNHVPAMVSGGLSQPVAAATLIGYAAVISLVAVATTVRRDVT